MSKAGGPFNNAPFVPIGERILVSEVVAAQLCSVSQVTFRKWVAAGAIQARRIARQSAPESVSAGRHRGIRGWPMRGTRTARAAAGSAGLPRVAMTTTPYRRGPRGQPVWVEVAGARRVGCHVELMTPDGRTFLVDLVHPIFPVRDDAEAH